MNRVVVFDLGGVLARICHTWQEAADVSGVKCDLGPGATLLADFPGFDAYQAGKIDLTTYLTTLSVFTGCSIEDALSMHNSIIVEEYPDVAELVADLEEAGWRTGCLSNTNAPHWEHLALNGRFPTIHRLQMKMASHLVGLNKPDPKIFRAFEREFGLEGCQIWFFDDHPANVRAARAAGWHATRIDPHFSTASQIRAVLQEADAEAMQHSASNRR